MRSTFCHRKPRGDEGQSCLVDDDCERWLVCGFDHTCRHPCHGSSRCCGGHGLEGYCKEGEGSCDKDSECEGSLVCGTSNCAWISHYYDDCCMQPSKYQ